MPSKFGGILSKIDHWEHVKYFPFKVYGKKWRDRGIKKEGCEEYHNEKKFHL